ncbi:hypothetical protein Aba7804_20975 (plasmid) [Acinetobacter baumannii]|jgi:hypothetical protein|nr:hypothetical protein Aba7804_20975 [Acinetobacter baumannii]
MKIFLDSNIVRHSATTYRTMDIYFGGVTHHCHIVETGNESWRFKESSTKGIATKRTKPRQTKIDQEELAIN